MSRPNILLIILDAVRAKSVSAYGYPVVTTPYLDQLAQEAILFRRTFAPGTWTIPTHVSLLTGLYPSQHHIESVAADRRLNDRVTPLPAILAANGYRTAAFSQNMLFSPEYHFDYFDEFHQSDLLSSGRRLYRSQAGARSNGYRGRLRRYVRKLRAPDLLLGSASDWMRNVPRDTPFFAMANITNAHYRWAPPPDILLRRVGAKARYLLDDDFVNLRTFPFNSGKRQVTAEHREIWRTFYDAAILHVDRVVGRFLKRLQQWSRWRDTIVIITADHGEMLGEHRDIVGHTLTLHDNIIHVPLVIRHPDYSGAITVERVVQTLDLFPSILEWTGYDTAAVEPAQLQRAPLSAAIHDTADGDGLAFAEEDHTDSYNVLDGLLKVNPSMDPARYPQQQIAVRSATHKYTWYDSGPGELYDMVSDPDETVNLIASEKEANQTLRRELHQHLLTWRAQLQDFPPSPAGRALTDQPAVADRLRALGYLA